MKILIDGPDQILYQWDKSQRLMLHGADAGTRVDFARCDQNKAVSVYAYAEDGAVFCDIPDALLMEPAHLHGYVYEIDGDRGETVQEFMLTVFRRPKPEDYVEPEDVPTWHELDQRIKKIEDEGVPDEKIAQAVEDYLEENPVQPGGSAGTVEIVDVVSLPALYEPTVTEAEDSTPAARKYILGIPAGRPGANGVGIRDTAITEAPGYGTWVEIRYTNGEEYTLTIPHGKDYILTPADKAEIAEMAAELVEVPEQDSSQNTALTAAQINALDGMFKVCAFIKGDISAEYTAFQTAFGISDSGTGGEEPDIPDEPDEPDVPTYTVTNNLTNVVNSNTQTTITEGFYSATLTTVDGYSMQSVVITMGGVDITADVYGDGGILITEVTGDIVITAVAGTRLAYALPAPFVFNGSSTEMLDTGYAMYAGEDCDKTVCIDMAITEQPWSAIKYVDIAAGVDSAFCIDQSGNKAIRAWNGKGQAGVAANGRTVIYLKKEGKGIRSYRLVDDVVTPESGQCWGYDITAFDRTATITIGSTNSVVKGTIDDFRVYEQVLSDAQIETYLRGGAI